MVFALLLLSEGGETLILHRVGGERNFLSCFEVNLTWEPGVQMFKGTEGVRE